MEVLKIRNLKKGSEININGHSYKVIDIDKGISSSEELKEFSLINKDENRYLLQLVLDKSLCLWKIAIDPLTNQADFSSSQVIRIKSIKF